MLGVSLFCDYCVEGALGRAYLAATTAVHIYEGRFIAVDANNGFGLTHLLS